MPNAHAKLSPSGAGRWVDCPGSIHAEPVVADTGSAAADEGTACHAVAEKCLRGGRKARFFVGETIKSDRKGGAVKVSRQMADWVQEGLDWVRNYAKEHPQAQVYSEQEIDIGPAFGLPITADGKSDLWGTADVVIISGQELVIVDFKFGYHYVEVLANLQLSLYSIGAEHANAMLSFEQVRHVIIQPQNGGAREEVVPIAELHERREGLTKAIHAALDPFSPRRPSERACQYCRAAPVCPALHEQALAVAKTEFAQIDTLSPEQLADILDKAPMVEKLLSAVATHALRLAQIGQPIPGYKVVRGRKHRAWTDEKKALKALVKMGLDEDEAAPRKVITPSQAEKAIGGKEGKAVVETLACVPEGEPTLVKVTDSRPALPPEFEVIP